MSGRGRARAPENEAGRGGAARGRSNAGAGEATGGAEGYAGSSPGMRARPGGVNVRMYRQGLGDAFLLAFDRGKGEIDDPAYVLIDCGVILGTPRSKEPVSAVVENIRASTGGHLDLLIVTHEHWDHVGAFQQVEDLWHGFRVDAVWMAWTEDPSDPLGVELKRQFKNDLDALCLAVERQRRGDPAYRAALAALPPDSDRSELPEAPFATLVGFFGEPEGILNTGVDGAPQHAGMAAFGRNTHAGMRNARSLAAGANVAYLSPGARLGLPGVDDPDVCAYILGPPRGVDLLRDINPSPRDPETYGARLDAPPLSPTEKAAFTLAVRATAAPGDSAPPLTPEERDVAGLSYPFDTHLGVDMEALEAAAAGRAAESPPPDPGFVEFLRDRYGFGPGLSGPEAPDWRRIENDWLGVADELALQMDSYTNNTSLVIAFELKDGSVLLFPGDAQVGSWISWDRIDPPPRGSEGETVRVGDLLARTVLYKVGHHGSHNATLREAGLERMTSDGLIALLPVDEKVAHEKKHWNEMPFDPLMARLVEKTNGRMIRADLGVITREKPRFVPDDLWARIEGGAAAFAASVRSGPDDPRVEPDERGRRPVYYEVGVPFEAG